MDINIKLTANLRLEQLINIMKQELADDFTVFYLHSITTEKGKELFASYLKKRGGETIPAIGK